MAGFGSGPRRTSALTLARSSLKSRLDEIIIRTLFEPHHPILDGVPGSQHDHRDLLPLFPQGGYNVQTAQLRRHQVEDNAVMVSGPGFFKAILIRRK